MISLFLASSLLYTSTLSSQQGVSPRDYKYVATELTYDEAQKYCMDTFNTNLATIITDEDFVDALTEINGRKAPWIGLRSVYKEGWFIYIDDEECPSSGSPYGGCLPKSRWVKEKPIECDEGSICVTLYSDNGGKVNNDNGCYTKRPFLCGAPVIVAREYEYFGRGTWFEAYLKCKHEGTEIAGFSSDLDIDNYQDLLTQNGQSQGWVGLVQSDAAILAVPILSPLFEGNWFFLDGTQCVRTDGGCTNSWAPGEPNNTPVRGLLIRTRICFFGCRWITIGFETIEDADCAVLRDTGLATDELCTSKQAIVCNKRSGPAALSVPLRLLSPQEIEGYEKHYGQSPKIEPNEPAQPVSDHNIDFWSLLKDRSMREYIFGFIILLIVSIALNVLCWCLFCNRQRKSSVKGKYESVTDSDLECVEVDDQ